jgi:DNA-binding response OmpR family regulator
MRILIADDDRMSTMMLGRTLESGGFDVTAVHDDYVIRPFDPALLLSLVEGVVRRLKVNCGVSRRVIEPRRVFSPYKT